MKVHFKNVKFDTDGESLESCGLKSDFIAEVEIDIIDATEDEITDMLSDWLSDNYGYCHNGFEYEIMK